LCAAFLHGGRIVVLVNFSSSLLLLRPFQEFILVAQGIRRGFILLKRDGGILAFKIW
jgi:hypothetical protein